MRSDAQWQRLAAHIGGGATDPRFARTAQRHALHDELDALLADWLRGQDALHAADTLQALGIAASPVMNAGDLLADAHLAARGWLLQVGDDRLPGLPFRYARGGGAVRHRGPRLGDANARCFGAAGQTPPDLDPASIGTAYATA